MKRLEGRVALITGAARGMGASHARLFVSEGARVILTDFREEQGRALAEELGSAALFVRQDVSLPEDWRQVIDAAEVRFGAVDILVNNAGGGVANSIENTTLEQYRRTIDVNQIGVFLGMQAVIPSMEKAGRGSIINVSSLAGLIGQPNSIAYTASKFAVTGMTKVAAKEFGGRHVRVNSIHPGLIMTPLVEDGLKDSANAGAAIANMASTAALSRAGQSHEVSNLVLFLASDEASYITGAAYVIDGGTLA